MSSEKENIKKEAEEAVAKDVNALADELITETQNQDIKDKPEAAQKKKGIRPAKMVQGMLDGTFLTTGQLSQLIPFIFYMVFLIMLLIANTYYAEKMVRQIEQIKKDLKELRYEQITTRSELMFLSKQSEVARRLNVTGLKESVVPPEKIMIKSTEDSKTNSQTKAK
ncbi:MAG: FtsL-like putative cell division protein [Bacteroidota bacterium]